MSHISNQEWTLIWNGNEKYPYPLSIQTVDGSYWVARGGHVSCPEAAKILADAPRFKRQRDDLLHAAEEALAELEGLEHSVGDAPAILKYAIAKARLP